MTLGLTDEECALQSRARAFSQQTVRPRAAAIDRDEQYPWDIVKALTDSGFVGMTIPKAYGGQGRSFLDAVLAIEEMAKSCTVTSRIVVETNMGAISTVMAYGTEAQKRLAADLVLAGDKPAICITEPEAGSDTMAMTTRAEKRGDTYVINGTKHWITGAGVSRLHLIFARVFGERGEEQGIGGFLAVRDEAKGLRVSRREQTMGLRGMPEGELVFEDLEVPTAMAVMPPSGFRRGFAELMNAYNSQRVGAGSVAMGIAAGALDYALDWVKHREQFGRPIGEFQGLQWQLADMQTQLTASRLML
jgi:alkylation response protein AidB-like acyl-CoA dehydrogenase